MMLLSGGCASSVTVNSEFPAPLIEPLPLRVGLYYSPQLTDYVHSEADDAETEWSLDLGNANIRMLDTVFAALFTATQRLASMPAPGEAVTGLDAIIAPAIDAVEISLPSQSRTDQYAVWIRYNLDVHAPDGQLVVRWPVSAYGQSDSDGLSGEKPMARAAVLALRDAEATIAVEFARQPKIREELLKETGDVDP
jgi:hypothetical protein